MVLEFKKLDQDRQIIDTQYSKKRCGLFRYNIIYFQWFR